MRTKFNVEQAISQAWDQLWKEKEGQRAKPSSWRGSEGFYITRQEIIRKVRAYAYADIKGLPREKADYDYGVRLNFNLDGAVCSWLSRGEHSGRLEGHAFGRNTITGRRYRPAGVPLSEVEKRTLKAKAERKPYSERAIHLNKASHWPGRAACAAEQKRALYRRSKGSSARLTKDWEKVSCPRCLKLIEGPKVLSISFHGTDFKRESDHDNMTVAFSAFDEASDAKVIADMKIDKIKLLSKERTLLCATIYHDFE